MKNLIFVISVMFIYGCNTNPNYERNLATAKKLFELSDISIVTSK